MEQTIFALLFSGIVIAGLFVAFLLELNKKNNEIKKLEAQNNALTFRINNETVKIEDLTTAIELSEHSINDISHRKQTEQRLALDIAKELSDRCLIRYECRWYRDRDIVKVVAYLRALPMDAKKNGKPYIYKPLHSETI